MEPILLSLDLYRYLDNVVNKQSISPPIPHLHALLTSGDDPPAEVDIFDLLKVSYEKFSSLRADDIEQMRFKQRLKVIQSLEDTAKRSVVWSLVNATVTSDSRGCRASLCGWLFPVLSPAPPFPEWPPGLVLL